MLDYMKKGIILVIFLLLCSCLFARSYEFETPVYLVSIDVHGTVSRRTELYSFRYENNIMTVVSDYSSSEGASRRKILAEYKIKEIREEGKNLICFIGTNSEIVGSVRKARRAGSRYFEYLDPNKESLVRIQVSRLDDSFIENYNSLKNSLKTSEIANIDSDNLSTSKNGGIESIFSNIGTQVLYPLLDYLYTMPFWVYIIIAFFVILIFNLLEAMMEKNDKLTYTLSIILSVPFLIVWILALIDWEEDFFSDDFYLMFFFLWGFITLIEITRRNLRKQWCRNIISCIVEVPLLFMIFWNIFLMWENIPDLFGWVNAKDTFWSMILYCILIIVGYFVIALVWNKVFMTWFMPGGSHWSLMLIETEFFMAVYRASLYAINGLTGFTYVLGIFILLCGILFMWGISMISLGSERCPRCHRIGSDYLGDADGGYEDSVSYKWYTKSWSSEKEVEQLDRIEETRHITNYYHKCPYCETEWQTSSSHIVDREITPVKQRITTWEKRW